MKGYEKDYCGKKVLVLGGSGFMGSNLVLKIVKLGADVTTLIAPGSQKRSDSLEPVKSNINIIVGDIRDAESINKVAKGQDFIFCMAGKSGAADSNANPFLDLDVNCRGQLNILEACRKINSEAKIIFPGSRLEFGKAKYLPVDENHPMEPTSIYGIHKLVGEKYHILYNQTFGLKTTVLRISNPYGPHQILGTRNYGVINYFIYLAVRGETIKVFGDGQQLRDYIFIDDLVDVMLVAGAEKRANGEIFNIGGGQGIKLIDVVNLIVEIAGSGKVEQVPWPKSFAKVETGSYVTDITKASKLLNWKPKTELEKGLERTIAFYGNCAKQNTL